eukprot:COSAG01_NODE_2721_length_7186_cov_3.571328_3_plen_228_part_00
MPRQLVPSTPQVRVHLYVTHNHYYNVTGQQDRPHASPAESGLTTASRPYPAPPAACRDERMLQKNRQKTCHTYNASRDCSRKREKREREPQLQEGSVCCTQGPMTDEMNRNVGESQSLIRFSHDIFGRRSGTHEGGKGRCRRYLELPKPRKRRGAGLRGRRRRPTETNQNIRKRSVTASMLIMIISLNTNRQCVTAVNLSPCTHRCSTKDAYRRGSPAPPVTSGAGV